jgi:hypothetical protein
MRPVSIILLGGISVDLCGLYALQGQADGGAWGAGSGSLAVQIVLLITTIAGFAYNLYREARNRRWDMEDRERARRELAQRVELATAKQATVATQHKDEILTTIDRNTQMNEKALHAANDVNRRIANIQRMFTENAADQAIATASHQEESAHTLHRVDDNTQETVDRLRKIVK